MFELFENAPKSLRANQTHIRFRVRIIREEYRSRLAESTNFYSRIKGGWELVISELIKVDIQTHISSKSHVWNTIIRRKWWCSNLKPIDVHTELFTNAYLISVHSQYEPALTNNYRKLGKQYRHSQQYKWISYINLQPAHGGRLASWRR